MTKIFLLDNFDSFTYNLVDELRILGFELTVFRNDVDVDALIAQITAADNPLLLLSPGPGNPTKAGNMLALLDKLDTLATTIPVLGVCLGHQAIIEQAGGSIGHAGDTVHGKVSMVDHQAHPVFKALPNPLPVARYHSLMATRVPDSLNVIAEFDSIPMAVIDENKRRLGLQFHPESILTTFGSALLAQCVSYLTEEVSC